LIHGEEQHVARQEGCGDASVGGHLVRLNLRFDRGLRRIRPARAAL
jgi:hypothetical protein